MTKKKKNEEKPSKENCITTKTLDDLGPNLPIGFISGDSLVKDFLTKPWRMKEEKEIGEIRDKAKGLTVGEFVRHMMGVMFLKVGPHANFQSLPKNEKDVIISQMYLADVLYAYVWLRVECLGSEIPLNVKCPICRYEYKLNADLKTLDIRVLTGPDKIKKSVELADGLKLHGEIRKKLTIRPPLWATMDDPLLTNTENPAMRDAAIIRGSVVGAEDIEEGVPVAILDNDLDELSKRDLVTLTNEIEDSPGPQMALESECPKCKTEFFQRIDWFYDSFFGGSSSSQAGKS